MSEGLNEVRLVGNLGADPEVRFLPSGQAVCDLRLAVNSSRKDPQGQWQEHCEWVRVVVWGKTAENVGQYKKKGDQVHISGRLQTKSFDDKTTGEKRYVTEVVADRVLFLGGGTKGDGAARGDSGRQPDRGTGSTRGGGGQRGREDRPSGGPGPGSDGPPDFGGPGFPDDEIPF